jgi:hypothetical protein
MSSDTPDLRKRYAEALAEKFTRPIHRVRELHTPEDVEFARGPDPSLGETRDVKYLKKCCSHCRDDDYGSPVAWPCPTIRALDEEASHG